MKTFKLADFLTDKQIIDCLKLCKNHNNSMLTNELVNYLSPLMSTINKKLEQENDVKYLAYAIQATYNQIYI